MNNVTLKWSNPLFSTIFASLYELNFTIGIENHALLRSKDVVHLIIFTLCRSTLMSLLICLSCTWTTIRKWSSSRSCICTKRLQTLINLFPWLKFRVSLLGSSSLWRNGFILDVRYLVCYRCYAFQRYVSFITLATATWFLEVNLIAWEFNVRFRGISWGFT